MSRSYKEWSKFSSKTADGKILKFRIVDVPDNRLKEVADLVEKYFVTEEAIFRASGVPENLIAMKEVKDLLLSLWDAKPYHITVCCIDDGTENVNDMIGASIMVLAKADSDLTELQPQTKEVKKFIEIDLDLFSKFDTLKTYGVDRIYYGRGIVVHPKYRRLGITRELFKIRRLICKERGVPMTGAWMSSIGSQKAAERDGWETVCEKTYEDLGIQFTVTFKDTPPTCKYMICRPE